MVLNKRGGKHKIVGSDCIVIFFFVLSKKINNVKIVI